MIYRIQWTRSAVELAGQLVKNYPMLRYGFRRKLLASEIEDVIHDQ